MDSCWYQLSAFNFKGNLLAKCVSVLYICVFENFVAGKPSGWNPKIGGLSMFLLFQGGIFRFQPLVFGGVNILDSINMKKMVGKKTWWFLNLGPMNFMTPISHFAWLLAMWDLWTCWLCRRPNWVFFLVAWVVMGELKLEEVRVNCIYYFWYVYIYTYIVIIYVGCICK